MELSMGINTENRIEITQSLSELLADTYILYIKTQNYHWNVTGIYFKYLHELFEEHYTEMAQAIDEIAERIRALGEYAPGSYQQFSQLSTIKETTTIPNWKEMLTNLLQDHEQVVNTARTTLKLASQYEDEVSVGLVTERMSVHEKTAWVLRSHL